MDTYSSSINNSLVQKLLTAIILAVAFLISAGMVVYLSLRGKEVKVPDLIGKTESDAEKMLGSEGLRFKVRMRTTDDKIQANLISEQNPNGGVTVKAGQVVTVTVSTGIEAKKVEAKAEAKPSATATAKPKPKPSPAGENQKGKDAASDPTKTLRDANAKDANKVVNKGEVAKGKPSPSPSVKASPKPTAKPSPKKSDTN